MYILGINAFHAGASACLVKDGQLIAAAEEERFNRHKYWAGFPDNAIKYCLHAAGITPADLDHVGISRDPSAHLMRKVLFTLSRRPSLDLVRSRLSNQLNVRDTKSYLAKTLSIAPSELRAEFHNVEHHRAHIASAFLVSPFNDAAVLSIDGMGDFCSAMWGNGNGPCIEVTGMVNFPHSLGFFYTALTQWLGFPSYGDEGKVMGLAAYGEPRYLDQMHKIVRLQRDGSYELDLDYFVIHTQGAMMSWDEGAPVLGNLYSSRLIDLLGEARVPRSEITTYHQDVAASLQAMLEEAEFSLVRMVQRQTGQTALALAGGVALNSSFNGKIRTHTPFQEIYIQPAAGDAGTALGVCYYIWNHILGQPRSFVMQDAFTGPSFSDAELRGALDSSQFNYVRLEDAELFGQTADLIAAGSIVGWFQDRMEWGPRALGNRSIIADPRRPEMKEVMNSRIKHREAFRPFAPSVLLEHVSEYFEQSYPDPFMLKVYNVQPAKISSIPAVTHVDGSARLQTVDRASAHRYWELIRAVGERTGVPVVLNTSFNDNEPIVCRPSEAIECFMRTRMDALALGNYLVTRE